MQTFKQLLLVSCCVTNATFCIEKQPLLINELPSLTAPEQMSGHQVRAGFSLLHREYRELSEGLTKSNAQHAEFNMQMQAALHKATRTGWPFSARLVAVALGAFIAWEHKEAFNKETVISAWDRKEVIAHEIKKSICVAYHTIKDLLQQRSVVTEPKTVVQEVKIAQEETPYQVASQRTD